MQTLTHSIFFGFPQLPLMSAYASMHGANGAVDSKLQKQKQRLDPKMHEPLFTNVTRDFKGTLDYILYTENSLQVCVCVCVRVCACACLCAHVWVHMR